jgi:putative ABC transport system permease protein
MFACLLLSYGYIDRELNYDRYNANAGRIVRLSLKHDDNPVDGRIYGNSADAVLQQLPEIEKVVKMCRVYTAVLTVDEESQVVNDIYYAGRDFFDVFSIPLIYGDKNETLNAPGKAVISESYARRLFGNDIADVINEKSIAVEGRQVGDSLLLISGIFKDIPETSHFHTDMLVSRAENLEIFDYTYLLLKENTAIPALEQKITQLIADNGIRFEAYDAGKTHALLMPLTDIHLHSMVQREMEPNGNINYVYLVAGANVLLLLVVMFNLWLNASLIFSDTRKYYQLLRMNGAPPSVALKDEAGAALLLGLLASGAGITVALILSGRFHVTPAGTVATTLIFLLLTVLISVIPALKNISSTIFLNTSVDLKPVRFSYSNVKYMLTAQYAIVMITVILAFGISRQMNLVKNTQTGGNDRNILVLKEQPDVVKERYALLKSELLKHPVIESVTALVDIPGSAIRDYIQVKPEGATEYKSLPIMVVDGDFLSFFNISPIAGRAFLPDKFDYKTHYGWLMDRFTGNKISDAEEEYIINRKAMSVLGFGSPEEAIGKKLQLSGGIADYINKGVICGVTGDFNYTGVRELTGPMIILQRQMFLHCIMVRLEPARFEESLAAFNEVWNEVNPDYPAGYVFMNDIFNDLYRNEINAGQLVYLFSILCLVVAELGLIIFMAFIVKRRRREIGIRRVNGAGVGEVIRLLNMNFVGRIALAFVIAVPVALYVLHRWLDNFAYKISLSWWIFAVSGLAVLLLSVASVSLQSWRAATANPVDAIRSE